MIRLYNRLRAAIAPSVSSGHSGVFVKPNAGSLVNVTNIYGVVASTIANAYDGDGGTSAVMHGTTYAACTASLRYSFGQVIPAGSKLSVVCKINASAGLPTRYDVLSVDAALTNSISLSAVHSDNSNVLKTLTFTLPQDTQAIDFKMQWAATSSNNAQGITIFDISVEL